MSYSQRVCDVILWAHYTMLTEPLPYPTFRPCVMWLFELITRCWQSHCHVPLSGGAWSHSNFSCLYWFHVLFLSLCHFFVQGCYAMLTQSLSYTPLSKCVIFILNYTLSWLREVNVFPSRPSIVGMNMSLSTLHQLFQFNISLYQYLLVFCFGHYYVDIRSDYEEVQVFDYLMVSELACSVSMNSYWLSSFSQFGRKIT